MITPVVILSVFIRITLGSTARSLVGAVGTLSGQGRSISRPATVESYVMCRLISYPLLMGPHPHVILPNWSVDHVVCGERPAVPTRSTHRTHNARLSRRSPRVSIVNAGRL